MKNTSYILSFLLLSSIVFFNACNKNNPANTNTTSSKYGHVKSYADGSGTTTFSYDAQGRLDSLVDVDFSGTTTLTLTYGSNSVVVSDGTTPVTYTLNGQGLATSDSKGNTYTYDGNGYLTSVIASATNYSKYAISNGNVTTVVTPYSATPDSIFNTFGTIHDYRDYGIPFLGKNSTFKTVFSASYGNGTNTRSNYLPVQYNDNHGGTYYWTYTYDSLGRVTSETQAQIGQNNGANLYTYTN